MVVVPTKVAVVELAFARYKGEAETALLRTGFSHVYIFRPAYIYPVEPRKEPNLGYSLAHDLSRFRTLFPIKSFLPIFSRAMVEVVLSQNEQGPVFENSQIRTMFGSIRGTHTASKGRT